MRMLDRCPVCNARDIRPLFAWNERPVDATWRVDTCLACTVAFTNPQPDWEELKPYYTKDYQPYQPPSAEEIGRLAEQAVRAGEYDRYTLDPRDRVLEIGPGGGRFLLLAQRICAYAMAVEPSEPAARMLREQGCNIFNGHIEQFAATYSGEKFTRVVMSHVLEHLPRPVEALNCVRQVLAPGGVIVMRMPNAGSWAFRSVKGDWMGTDLPRHLIHWNHAALEALATRAGMKVVRTAYDSPPGIISQALTARARFGFKIPDKLVWLAPGLIDKLSQRLSRRWVTPDTAMNLEVQFQAD